MCWKVITTITPIIVFARVNGATMRRVVGIHATLTQIELAIITQRADGTTVTNTTQITSRSKRSATLADRALRINHLATQVLELVGAPELAVIATPEPGLHLTDRQGLFWLIATGLVARGSPVTPAPPADAIALAARGAVQLGWTLTPQPVDA